MGIMTVMKIFREFCVSIAIGAVGLTSLLFCLNHIVGWKRWITLKTKQDIYENKKYLLEGFWEEKCWVQALEKLNDLKNNKNVINAGHFSWGSKHAWIEYTIIEKDELYRIGYDPTNNKEFFKLAITNKKRKVME